MPMKLLGLEGTYPWGHKSVFIANFLGQAHRLHARAHVRRPVRIAIGTIAIVLQIARIAAGETGSEIDTTIARGNMMMETRTRKTITIREQWGHCHDAHRTVIEMMTRRRIQDEATTGLIDPTEIGAKSVTSTTVPRGSVHDRPRMTYIVLIMSTGLHKPMALPMSMASRPLDQRPIVRRRERKN